ncbi:MAG: acylglycerol kinase family protein [Dongiaceae bacterium]
MNDVFRGPIGLIVNPRSRRNRERLDRVRAVYRAAERMLTREIENVADIPSVLSEFAAAGTTLLAVSGGDGTVQATMTALIGRNPFASMPPLAVLAGGMTNVTGHRLGIPGKPDLGLTALLQRRDAGRPLNLLTHPVLSVRANASADAQYGLLLGGAAFYDTTQLARRRVHPVGFAQSTAAAAAALILIGHTVVAGRKQGTRIGLRGDNAELAGGNCYLFLATTLPGLILGADPFWGAGEAPIRWTWVKSPPRRFVSALLPLIRGTPRDWMENEGYHSGRVVRLAIDCDAPLLFDGERIDPVPGEPIIVEGGHALTFARL